MKARLFSAVAALLCVSTLCLGQITTERGSASDLINAKIQKIDLLIKLVPLALKKDQYPDLLAGLEKARELEREVLKKEDDDLAELDGPLTEALQNALEKGIYPGHDIQEKVTAKYNLASGRRMAAKLQMIKIVYAAIQNKLNAGQRKAMAGSFSSQYVSPGIKPEDVTDEVKINFFIKNVFLDPLAYDLLVEMSRHAS